MKQLLNCIATAMLVCMYSFLHAQNMNEDQQKAYANYMTPGPVHQMMAKAIGDWKVESKVWMDPAAKAPTQTMGNCTNSMILGGRYLQSKHTGDFNGMPFEGVATTGYDNAKKVYVTSWIDNMGTGMMYMEGTFNDKDRSITYTGTAVDPMTGKPINVRQVQRFPDDNTMLMEMYMSQNGKEFKTMEIKMTRK